MLSEATYQTLLPAFDALQSERLMVRPYQESDAQALFEAVDESREHLLAWIGFANRHQTVKQSQEWINRQRARWILREEFSTGLWELSTERYLGDCRLYPRN
jgi:ribosomal-protein-serine acetyltransferase